MQYLLIILLNVFMWAVFYLVISLKLEKSASHFREKKFREEMDRLMTEFNSAADRNISLLENRITTLKKLLERTGNLDSIDLKLGSSERKKSEIDEPGKTEIINESIDAVEKSNGMGIEPFSPVKSAFMKKSNLSFRLLTRKFSHLVDSLKNFTSDKNSDENIILPENSEAGAKRAPDESRGSLLDMVLESDSMSELTNEEIPFETEDLSEDTIETAVIGEEDISEMFSGTDDKFSVISKLFTMGYTVEMISEYSGMPAGEVKLVLNLQGPPV